MPSKETKPRDTVDASLSMKERLQTDLRSAIRARSLLEVRVLRALLTAIDNAQAVPVSDAHVRYRVRKFGDGSAEVPRVPLARDDVRKIFDTELSLRHSAVAELERCGKSEAARESREEAAIIARYSKSA